MPARGMEPVWGPPGAGMLALRENLAERASRLLPGFPGRFATAVMLGRGSALTPEERSVFRRTGASHLVAVSGLHVGLVVSLVTLALGGAPRGLRAAGSLAAAWGYAGPRRVGGARGAFERHDQPLVRRWASAPSRAAASRGSPWRFRGSSGPNPQYLHSASFRLSAGAVAGLIFAMEIAPRCAGRRGTLLTSVVASLGAQWGTLPTSLQVFGTLSPLATLPNLLAIPLTALFLPATLLALAVESVPAAGLGLSPRRARDRDRRRAHAHVERGSHAVRSGAGRPADLGRSPAFRSSSWSGSPHRRRNAGRRAGASRPAPWPWRAFCWRSGPSDPRADPGPPSWTWGRGTRRCCASPTERCGSWTWGTIAVPATRPPTRSSRFCAMPGCARWMGSSSPIAIATTRVRSARSSTECACARCTTPATDPDRQRPRPTASSARTGDGPASSRRGTPSTSRRACSSPRSTLGGAIRERTLPAATSTRPRS